MFVLVLDDNLLTSAAILEQLRRGGHEAIVAGTLPDVRKNLPRRPDAILINLTARTYDPPALIRQLRADPGFAGGRMVGFCGHLDHTRRARALEAGCDRVITHAQAIKQLNEVLAGLRR